MHMFDVFSNREIAIFIWGTPTLLLLLFNKGIRSSILNLLKIFFSIKILIPIILAGLYTWLIVYFLDELSFWNLAFLKDTIFWFLGVAFIMLMSSNDATTDEDYFKKAIKDNFKLILILEFILNFYVFSLMSEIIFLPILVLISIMFAVASTKSEYKVVEKLMENILVVLGTIIFIISIYKVVSDFYSLATLDTLKSFLLPIILTVSFLPCVYLLALFSIYEMLLIRIKMREQKDISFSRFAIKQIFFKCTFNLKKLRILSRNLDVVTAKTKEELLCALAE